MKSYKTKIWCGIVVILGGLFVISSTGNALAQNEWEISTIDSGGSHTSIALDSNDAVHISYLRGDNLNYATNASGTWVTSTIEVGTINTCGLYSAIAVDSNDAVHISYFDFGHYVLKYATNADGSWKIYTIDSDNNADVGWCTSIALDFNDHVHISYARRVGLVYHEDSWDLKYATNASGSWETYIIHDTDHDVGVNNSIAVDSDGHYHISYRDVTANALRYVTNAFGNRVYTLLDTTGPDPGWSSSIAIDSNDNVHIGYGIPLKYTTNASGAWVFVVIDDPEIGTVGGYVSIALDSNDDVHISYFDHSNFDIKYATNVSGAWVTEVIDSNSFVGEYTSIAIDSNDFVHISYYDRTNSALKYATNKHVPCYIAPSVLLLMLNDVSPWIQMNFGPGSNLKALPNVQSASTQGTPRSSWKQKATFGCKEGADSVSRPHLLLIYPLLFQ